MTPSIGRRCPPGDCPDLRLPGLPLSPSPGAIARPVGSGNIAPMVAQASSAMAMGGLGGGSSGWRCRGWSSAHWSTGCWPGSSRGSTGSSRLINAYGRVVAVLRLSFVVLVLYGGLIGLTYLGFTTVPVGFIPAQDKGYLIVDIQLPYGASLERTDAVLLRASDTIVKVPGVAHAVGIAGFSGAPWRIAPMPAPFLRRYCRLKSARAGSRRS